MRSFRTARTGARRRPADPSRLPSLQDLFSRDNSRTGASSTLDTHPALGVVAAGRPPARASMRHRDEAIVLGLQAPQELRQGLVGPIRPALGVQVHAARNSSVTPGSSLQAGRADEGQSSLATSTRYPRRSIQAASAADTCSTTRGGTPAAAAIPSASLAGSRRAVGASSDARCRRR